MSDFAVYRLYDEDGGLLYIGASRRPLDRVQDHKMAQTWGWQIDHVLMTWCDTWSEARELEGSEIFNMRPRWNTGGRGERRVWQLSDYVEVILAMDGRRHFDYTSTAKLAIVCRELGRRWPHMADVILPDLARFVPEAVLA